MLLGTLVPQIPEIPFLLSVFFTAFLCLVIEKIQKHAFIAVCLVTAAAGGSFLFFSGSVITGLIWFWNQVAQVLGKRAGIYLTVYQQEDVNGTFFLTVFFLYLGIVVGVLGFFFLKIKSSVILLLWAFLLPVLMVLTDLTPDGKLCMFFYAGVLLELNFMSSCEAKTNDTFSEISPFLSGSLFVAVIAFAGVFFLQALVSGNDYQDLELVVNAKEEALEMLSHIRYGGQKLNSLPDGELKKTASWTASEDTALEVTMEHPSSVYLRGFVGSVYDGSSWKSISVQDAYEEKNLFYWLHQDGFYAQTQLFTAGKLVNDDTFSQETGTITVKNKNASRKYLYTPYELSSLPNGYEKETPFTDSMLVANGLFGQKNYSFSSSSNLVGNFTTLSSEVYQALQAGKGSDYRNEESYYNAFVYQADTKISASLENLFRELLGDGGNRDEGHTDYYTAISRIRAYLEKNMTYSTATDLFSESGDFTEHFLTESKIGHSVHFATAATLMFRYYGIPARYVEGYLITPADIEEQSTNRTILVPGKNGHAWTEIYIDGLGWIPLEMTPAYYGVMEEADLKTGLEAKGKLAVSIPESVAEPPKEENIRTNWSLKLALFGMEKFLLLFLIVFDFFCLAFILAVFALRIRTNWKRKKRFASRDNRIAVRAMAGYARTLYQHGPQIYSEETRSLYASLCQAGQKAAFSPHQISAMEKHDAASCIRHMILELKKSRNWYDRWIMKYIERLY